MLRTATYLIAVVAMSAVASAQAKKAATVADFAGTWNIELMSHQVALVIEPAEGNTVTATMMMMGNDLPLKGELVDGTLSLVGVKTEGATGSAAHHRTARRRGRSPPDGQSPRCSRKTGRWPAR